MRKIVSDLEDQKRVDRGEWLPLMESFYTIQGEGFHTGKAAYFIRIGGCDVGCHWCDVKESWNAKLHPVMPIEEVVSDIHASASTVVVTGGEPLTWNMDPLTEEIKKKGLQVHIETSGAYSFSGKWDWICLSPKKTAPPVDEAYVLAHELKVVIYNKHDFIWAEEHAERVGTKCALFLQPEWSRRKEVMPIISEYIMNNPKWRVSLQTHKYLGIP
jgi:organic radical activating enzyme